MYVLGTQMNMWRMQGLIRYIPPPLASSVLAAQTRVLEVSPAILWWVSTSPLGLVTCSMSTLLHTNATASRVI